MLLPSRRLLIATFVLGLAGATSPAVRAQYDCGGVSMTSSGALWAVPVVEGLSQALFVAAPPDDLERVFIVEQAGRIKIHKHGTPATTVTTFLDITSRVGSSSGEMGLLGLAFDPDYATTGHFWVNYTETVLGQLHTVVARYTASPPNADTVNPATEARVLRFVQPESNHNGGMLLFGPDGFLYVFTGDGGGAGDQHGACGNGQNRSVLLGKILRLDVRAVDPQPTSPDCGLAGAKYSIPSSNPFRDGPGGLCDEIWAYGLRNPWRPSFDALTGDLYVADVGQGCWEEINWVAGTSSGGENYGWRQMEGLQCYGGGGGCTPPGVVCGGSPPCNDPGFTPPVLNYQHVNGACSVTGGYVYRGCRMAAHDGTYFYGDLCAGSVYTTRLTAGVASDPKDVTQQLLPTGSRFNSLTSFGVDGRGEPYVVQSGRVWKIVPPYADLEVSGRGSADALRLDKTGDWTWEDIFLTIDVPVTTYRVYRGSVEGAYSCVFRGTTPRWTAGGDPAIPDIDGLFTYVVTAVTDLYGLETSTGTTGVFDRSTCP